MYSGKNETTEMEKMQLSGRAAIMPENNLWMDEQGKRVPVRYTIHRNLVTPDDEMKEVLAWFENEANRWTTETCLTFEKHELPYTEKEEFLSWCTENVEKKDKLLLLRESGNIKYGISPKKGWRCLDGTLSRITGRGVNEAYVGQMLGLMHIVYRPDRDTYISFNHEHMHQVHMSRALADYFYRCWNVGAEVPIPMDFLSIMTYHSYIYTNEDTLPVLVSRDPYQQYLFEYANYQAPPPSPLDTQTINLMYKCTGDWAAACRESGKEVPKCKNYGYITKECVCSCLPVYTGKLCETKTSTNFPYPLKDGVFNYTITEGGVYDLGKLMPIRIPSDPKLAKITFIIVKLEPTGKNVLPFISVRWNSQGVKTFSETIKGQEAQAMETVNTWDCDWGIRMLWGNNNNDKGRRLACECTSVFGFNEPKENARVLSARSENMTLTFINRLGSHFHSDDVATDTMKFILETEFRVPPKLTPKQNRSSDDGGDGVNSTVSGVNGTESPLTATAAAMTAAGGAGGMAAIIGAVTALLLLCLLCLLLMKRRKKKKKLDELGEEEEDNSEDSGSGSD